LDALLSVPFAYRWIATVLFVAVIVGLSVTPGVDRPDDSLFSWLFANTAPPVQKVLHVVIYAVLAALWMWTLAGITSMPVRIGLSFALALALGVVLEWYQTTVPGRYGTMTDVLLNTLGVVLGLAAALFLL
jgi:hypothetical protein